jgi:hypothetical protein
MKSLRTKRFKLPTPITILVLASLFLGCVGARADGVGTASGGSGSGSGSGPKTAMKQRSSYVPPTAELFKKLSPAVVKIVIKKSGVAVATGSGFFVTKDGVVITSKGLIRLVLADATATAELTLFDKTSLKEFKVISCAAHSGGNLCALKFSHEPKAYFSLAEGTPNEGEGASIIGHPRGIDFAITRGMIEKITKNEKSGDQLTVSGAFAPGNEGAPVFDDQGRLIGVNGKYDPEKPEANVIFPVGEVATLTESDKLPMTLSEARRQSQQGVRVEMHRRATEELDPALQFAARSKSLDGLKGFKDVAISFDDKVLRLTLPETFDDCPLTQKTRQSTMHACYAFGDTAVLTVQRLPNKGYEELLQKNGKRLMEPRPVTAIDELIRTDAWEDFEKSLTPAQKKAFFSDASLAQCQSVKSSLLPSAAFSSVPACRFSVANDTELGGYSVNVWLLKDQYLYAVAMWMNDAAMAEYFSRIPILAVLTARWEKSIDSANLVRGLASELSTKPLPTYKVEMPDAVSFMGAKLKGTKGGGQLDLYGKKLLLDKFEDGFVVAVTNQKKSYLPPDFDDVTKKAMGDVTKSLGAKTDLKTLEIEPTNVAGRPARLLTVFGKDTKGREVLVLTSSIFYDDQTFEITQIAVSKDPGATFREFKDFLAGFKRK